MSIDMKLISLKDGGRFAMSWIAGTNPKALRSTYHNHQIYSIDVTEVCEEIIESLRMKKRKLSFRILFRLCFGTIYIYAEQVRYLYDVTLNFVCFNTFVMKQYSRKRLSSTTGDIIDHKKIRLDSSEDLDISTLLKESELFNDYTEERFQFPNEMGHQNSDSKNKNTSTCIQINQITIRHVSWDCPMPEDVDEFGEASQDERSILLSGLTDDCSRKRSSLKRKPCYNPSECSPCKRSCPLNESIDDVRYESSINYDTMSEYGILPLSQRIYHQSGKNTTDLNDNDFSQIDFESTRIDNMSAKDLQSNGPNESHDYYALEDSSDMPLPDFLEEYVNRSNEDDVVDTSSRIDSPDSSPRLSGIPCCSTISTGRKRKSSGIIIDTHTKLTRIDIDNVWKNCHDVNYRDHLAISPKEVRKPISFTRDFLSRRTQSDKLLKCFKKNLKLFKKQTHDYNRQLLIREILCDDFNEFKHLFKIKTSEDESIGRRKSKERQFFEKSRRVNDFNNNIQLEEEQNHQNQIQELNTSNLYETGKKDLELRCPLYEIDPFAITFDFQCDTGTQRSEWGKEGIMNKLLFAWISEDSLVNMKSIIVGASRINAALAFHTLLDLSAQQYIEIIKNSTNSIESIKMGPETIRKINECCVYI